MRWIIFTGDLMKGTKASGYAAYPLTDLNTITGTSSLRLKINSTYEMKDDDDAHHKYDISLNFN